MSVCFRPINLFPLSPIAFSGLLLPQQESELRSKRNSASLPSWLGETYRKALLSPRDVVTKSNNGASLGEERRWSPLPLLPLFSPTTLFRCHLLRLVPSSCAYSFQFSISHLVLPRPDDSKDERTWQRLPPPSLRQDLAGYSFTMRAKPQRKFTIQTC